MTVDTGAKEVHVARRLTTNGADVWIVTGSDWHGPSPPSRWVDLAERLFSSQPEVASLSIVRRSAAWEIAGLHSTATWVQSPVAALPVCYVNSRIAELIGIDSDRADGGCAASLFKQWMDTATLKGLVHAWHLVDDEQLPDVQPLSAVRDSGRGAFIRADAWLSHELEGPPIAIGIDAAWLLGGESGAQVFAFEMLKELARRPQIGRVVMLSESGVVPPALEGTPKVSGSTWQRADTASPLLDIIHRPYQPGVDVDYVRYHRAGDCVAVTVLDFIAYDNPWYHETERAWQQYRQGFDENVCLADCVFAISAHVAARITRQFGHALSGPVLSVPLGTDHLSSAPAAATMETTPVIAALKDAPFLLVLGNDFAHKNRDFAVRVFIDMRNRGYRGRLALAGFHLDLGSSYATELADADRNRDSIIRTGSVSTAEKTWLMQHADAVLYPTSSEGFGLVPFEAAALGTPTAFVRFGPLRETLATVAACDGWRVRPFADHVFMLIGDRQRYVDQVRSAGAALTWSAHVDAVLDGYNALLRSGAPWRSRGRQLPGSARKIQQAVAAIRDRVTGKVSRVLGVPKP